MVENRRESRVAMIRVAGLAALLGALLNAAADVVLQGTASGSYTADMQFMWGISEPRLRVGAYLGVLVIPIALVGFWHVYRGLKQAGRGAALPPVLIGSYATAVAPALHFGLLYPALVGHAILDAGGPAGTLRELHDRMNGASTGLWLLVLLGFAVFSLWFMILVLSGRTGYPRWFGLLNPLFLMITLVALLPLVPLVGHYLWPAATALAFALFFGGSTILLWNGGA
jgi:hypothetical protein